MGTTPAVLRMHPAEQQNEVKIARDPGDPEGRDKWFNAYRLQGDAGGVERLKEDIEKIKSEPSFAAAPFISHFLSITFREIEDLVDAKHYDLNSPWCFPVQIQGDYERIFRIGDASGELPNYDWYGVRWKNEFSHEG